MPFHNDIFCPCDAEGLVFPTAKQCRCDDHAVVTQLWRRCDEVMMKFSWSYFFQLFRSNSLSSSSWSNVILMVVHLILFCTGICLVGVRRWGRRRDFSRSLCSILESAAWLLQIFGSKFSPARFLISDAVLATTLWWAVIADSSDSTIALSLVHGAEIVKGR